MSQIRPPPLQANASQARFEQGLAAHRSGRLPEALRLYEQALAIDPGCFDAIHLLGVVALQTGEAEKATQLIARAIGLNDGVAAAYSHLGLAQSELKRHAEALASFDRAIALNPDFAEAYSNRGNALQDLALQDLARLEEALASYDRAIALDPEFVDARINRGNALQKLGRFVEAIASYDAAIALKPDSAKIYCARGAALWELRRLEPSLASYDAAIVLEPNRDEAWFRRGRLLEKLRRLDEALTSYDRAIALRPGSFESHNNRGNVLLELRRFDQAAASYDTAIALRPEFAEAHYNRGKALQEAKDLDAAIASYGKAIEICPGLAPAHGNLGNVLFDAERSDEAVAAYETAIALKPDFAEAHSNLGNVMQSILRLDEAFAHYDKAIKLRPDFADALANKSLCLLLIGDYESGLRLYEQRKKLAEYGAWSAARSYPQKLWLGEEDLAGKTLFVYWEQGLGDTIMFCRFLPLAERCGARIVLSAQNRLHRLLKTLSPSVELIGETETAADFDLHCSLISLPLAFGARPETIPADVPYLKAEPWRVEKWRRRIGDEGFRIGIAWQGNRAGRVDIGRSFDPGDFYAVAQIPGVRLISLQKQEGVERLGKLPQGMKIESLGDEFDSGPDAFVDSAAAMETLDLVISSDSAIVHLAGALARPVWTALKHAPDWRWMLGRGDSPWHPTMRLFRQRRRGDWSSVFREIAEALPALVAAKANGGAARESCNSAPKTPVSWGELIDKIAILEIKSQRLPSEAARANARKELALLAQIAETRTAGDVAAYKEHLSSINAELWDIEDRIREKEARQEFDADFVALARSVYRRNDARAEVKKKINLALASEIVEEKSYPSYQAKD